MGLRDQLKEMTSKADNAAAQHKQQIQQTINRAQAAADKRTRGRYHDQITKATAKAERYLDDRASTEPQPPHRAGSHPASKSTA
jgi:ElaB/YqjD/DUF883 family membrane-anchored ribosome-binding protein